jgi:hypothetical protein
MPGRSPKKREERKRRLEEEEVPRRIRERAEHRKELFFLERQPKKQYIRYFGWLQVIQDYVERRRNDGVDRPISYLTFPGPAATDVGMLWQAGLLVRTEAGFPNVVVCDEEYADESLAVLGAVRGVSAQPIELAILNELTPFFPIDVVNFDIYGAVVTGHPRRRKALRRLAAIRRVFWLQKGQSFLLLLTTSTDDPTARRYLENVLVQNLDEDDFREAYLDRYGVVDLSPFHEDYRTFVSIVLPKAIGKMARDRGYRIAEHFAARYDSRGGHRMLCHSFELEPVGVRDPKNKYKPRFKRIRWDRLDELSEELSNRARKLASIAYEEFIPTLLRDIPDVSEILQANPGLAAEMVKQSESLIGWEKQNESDFGI